MGDTPGKITIEKRQDILLLSLYYFITLNVTLFYAVVRSLNILLLFSRENVR